MFYEDDETETDVYGRVQTASGCALAANGGKLSVVARQLDIAPVVLRSWRDRGRGELQLGRAVQLPTLHALHAPAALCSPANSNGELLPHAKNRGCSPPYIQNQGPGKTSLVPILRNILQSNTVAFRARLYIPSANGAKSGVTLSTFSEEDQRQSNRH